MDTGGYVCMYVCMYECICVLIYVYVYRMYVCVWCLTALLLQPWMRLLSVKVA